MLIHIDTGALKTVAQSGVGQAVLHQRAALACGGVAVTDSWRPRADAVHINTVFPASVLAALRARRRGETVLYYGHSTEQDFRDSFPGSNLLSPLFRRWLCFCYSLGDVVVTPTPYSKRILESYGLRRPVVALSNGVDTDFFAPDPARGAAFRRKYGVAAQEKVVVSVGLLLQRKGLPDFIALARAFPQVRFFWFGHTAPALMTREIRAAVAAAPPNLCFAGYAAQPDLRDAYCGADAFVFCSHEETEGIVVLEALACGTPVLVRDIPVYADWLNDGQNCRKAADLPEFRSKLAAMLDGTLPPLTAAARQTALDRSYPAIAARLCALYKACGAAG